MLIQAQYKRGHYVSSLLQFLWEWFNCFHLDECVLLRPHPFSTGAVVVHARLLVDRRVDGVPLSKLHLPSLPQVLEVPTNERVVVRIGVCGDERATPVNLKSTTIQHKLTARVSPTKMKDVKTLAHMVRGQFLQTRTLIL